MRPSIALTIAGSDSSGGAGIQADIKTFAAFGVYGTSVLTAITAQNTQGVRAILDVDPRFVIDQLEAILDDLNVGAAKTGMLGRASVVEAVVAALSRRPVPHLVVDPVMTASAGTVLLDPGAVECLRERLLPITAIVTPNLREAEILAHGSVSCVGDMREAARALVRLGARAALVTGGHLHDARGAGGRSGHAIDVLYDGQEFSEFSVPRVATASTHGTGCALSAAITAGLARGQDLYRAVENAKNYVTSALRTALDIGRGVGPINHNCLKDPQRGGR